MCTPVQSLLPPGFFYPTRAFAGLDTVKTAIGTIF
jgi:hypothetical protein